MSGYEIACLVLGILVVLDAAANITIWLLGNRKKRASVVVATEPNQEEVVAEPIEEANEEPVAEPVAEPIEETVAEPIEEPIVVEEELAEEPVAEYVEETIVNDNDADPTELFAALESGSAEESDSGAVVQLDDGSTIYYGYNKSFTAKLIQATDEVREFYNVIKNYLLSYDKVKTSISWNQESVRLGKEKVCWLVLRGKSLYLYLPLNPDDYADSKYKVERASAKRYEAVPCLFKIKNMRRAKYATELIAVVLEKLGAERVEKKQENYLADYPHEDTLSLIKRELIKTTKSRNGFGRQAED